MPRHPGQEDQLPPSVTRKGGKVRIDAVAALRRALESRLPRGGYATTLDRVTDATEREARARRFGQLSQGALNNVRGIWYEMLVEVQLWNYLRKWKPNVIAVPIPNVTAFDLGALFDADTKATLTSLRGALEVEGVHMITSNPDFLFFKGIRLSKLAPNLDRRITLRDVDGDFGFSRQVLDAICGKVRWDQLFAGLSIKVSLRPDRRLQASHEGNVLKALYAHLKMRYWKAKPRFRYYCAAMECNDADRDALSTAATHTIVNVESQAEAAVDQLFKIHSQASLASAVEVICASAR